jgi:hypothetical protein
LPAVIGGRLLGVFLGFALAVAVSGCNGGGEDGRIATGELRKLVLQSQDLPRVFAQFDFRELAPSDFHQGPREDPAAFGRIGGWVARYRRSGSQEIRGPLLVESRVDLFEDEDGAVQDLDAYEAEFEQTSGATALEPPEVGTGAVVMTLKQGSGRFAVRFFTIAWRQSHVTASISVNGFEQKIFLRDVLQLVRRQERRIAASLE